MGVSMSKPVVEVKAFIAENKLSEEEVFLSEEHINEITEAFIMCDTDGSNDIDFEEIRTMFKKLKTDLPDAEIKLMMQAVDLDKNGKISFDEFLLMMVKAQDPNGELLDAFNEFDTDRNGFIDVHEIQQAMGRAGHAITKEQAEEMINNADMDNDGQISFFEFKEMLKRK